MKRRIQFATVLLLTIVLGAFLTATIRPYYTFLTQTLNVSPVDILLNRIPITQDDNRTNILILGLPDDDRAGANLTDSITFLSYDHQEHALVSMGIPRDIWSPTLQDKINSAYAYGETKKEGGGITLANAEISALLNKPIHHTVVIRFSEFEELIDSLGGIEVTVENGFSDPEFPIAGKENDECFGMDDYSCRYETVTFEEGTQLLTGERALQFVRSRHAEGDEGSDFSRSRRQQLVLSALEDKFLAEVENADIKRLNELYQLTNSLIERTISNEEAVQFAKNLAPKGMPTRSAISLPNELFTVPELWIYERYVLLPSEEPQFSESIDCIYEQMNAEGCVPSVTSDEELALEEE